MRIACLVDGFNLYHSVRETVEEGEAACNIKWLDLRGLLNSKLDVFEQTGVVLGPLYYCTALPKYKTDGTVDRHAQYIKVLQSQGFEIVYGQFRDKTVKCGASCREEYTAHVEKQTDVNIAVKLMEVYKTGDCEGCLIMTGDGDLISAVRTAQLLYPEKLTGVIFPYKRWHRDLSQRVKYRVRLECVDYLNNVLPDPLVLPSGKILKKPSKWV